MMATDRELLDWLEIAIDMEEDEDQASGLRRVRNRLRQLLQERDTQ